MHVSIFNDVIVYAGGVISAYLENSFILFIRLRMEKRSLNCKVFKLISVGGTSSSTKFFVDGRKIDSRLNEDLNGLGYI